jgi:hypothetical protein
VTPTSAWTSFAAKQSATRRISPKMDKYLNLSIMEPPFMVG